MMLRKLIFFVSMLATLQCFSQSKIEKVIKRISKVTNAFGNKKNTYIFSYSDSSKFSHPYITYGKSIGELEVKNSQDPSCRLLYHVYEYDNKDSISKQIFKFYSLSSAMFPSPFSPSFFYKKYVFFMSWCCPYWESLDDRCKYMSIKIHDNAELNSKYDKD
jgi:hypothetical protein